MPIKFCTVKILIFLLIIASCDSSLESDRDKMQREKHTKIHKSSDNNTNVYIMSPIGKILVEDQTMTQISNSSTSKVTNAKNTTIHNSSDNTNFLIMSPIGKILVEDQTMTQNSSISTPKVVNAKKRLLFMSEPVKSNLDQTNKTCSESNLSNLTTDKFMMPTSETFIENSSSNSAHILHHAQYDPLNLDEIFSIANEESLNDFETKVETHKDFRSNVVSKLALLVGIKNVGDSIRRIMSKMFSDKFLEEYSLQGLKKKKKFMKLRSYGVLIDSLRTHSKYKSIVEKEFHDPLASWLSHAKYRLANNNKN